MTFPGGVTGNTLESGSSVGSSNLPWGARWYSHLYGERVNVRVTADLTPSP
jgi:hypothetical protein